MDKCFPIRYAHHELRNIILGFDYLEDYRAFTLSAVEKEKRLLNESFEQATKGMSPEEMERRPELDSEEFSIVDERFSDLSLKAFVIILYSYIETGLNSLCDTILSDHSRLNEAEGKMYINLRYVDMNGKGIERAKLYLEKVFNIDLHVGDPPWAEIDALRKIRNSIVLDEGRANKKLSDNKCVRTCIDNGFLAIEQLSDEREGKLIVKPGYLAWVLGQAKIFFENVKLNS